MKMGKSILNFIKKSNHVRLARKTMKIKSYERGLVDISTSYKVSMFKLVCGTDVWIKTAMA